MDRLVIALLAGIAGLIIGLFSPAVLPQAEQAQDAQRAWLNPPTRTPLPTSPPLVLPRAVAAQTAVPGPPPTLQPASLPTPLPTPVPEPTSPVRSFVVALRGGGAMTVVASDEAAARNNVKSTGAVPAD